MENKRKNVYITIFALTTIIASCLALYFYIDKNKDIDELSSRLEEKQKVIDDQDVKIKEDTETKENKKKDENSDISSESKVETQKNINLRAIVDYSKCLNVQRNSDFCTYRRYNDSFTSVGVTITNPNLVSISYNPIKLADLYQISNDENTSKNYVEVSIPFPNQKVIDIYIMGFGQAIGYETIFFLMEDGSVEYLPIRYAFKNKKFESYGKIEGIKDVIKIENFSVGYKNGGGWIAIFGITSEGSYYDISEVLGKNNYYDMD